MRKKLMIIEFGNGYLTDDMNDPNMEPVVSKSVDEVLYQVRCLLTGEGISSGPWEAPGEGAKVAPVLAASVEDVEPGDMLAIRERIRGRLAADMRKQREGK